MRCVAQIEDGQAYRWHAVSPGEGMGFLQKLNKELKKYNCTANLFDWHETGCKLFAPNFSEEDLTFEMAKILVKTGVQRIESVEKGAEATGTLATESAVTVQTRGQMLKYDASQFLGAATESDVQDSLSVNGSGTASIVGAGGATADVFRYNLSLDKLHIENRTGNFVKGETVTITKEDTTTFQVTLDSSFGSPAQQGQRGPLLAVKSGTTTLNATGIIKLAANIKIAGDTKYYRVGLVSEEDTTNGTAVVRLTDDIITLKRTTFKNLQR